MRCSLLAEGRSLNPRWQPRTTKKYNGNICLVFRAKCDREQIDETRCFVELADLLPVCVRATLSRDVSNFPMGSNQWLLPLPITIWCPISSNLTVSYLIIVNVSQFFFSASLLRTIQYAGLRVFVPCVVMTNGHGYGRYASFSITGFDPLPQEIMYLTETKARYK